MHNSLITGANRGIGLEYVRQLLARSDRVFATCRQPKQAQALQTLQDQYPDKMHILALDVRDDAAIARLADTLKAEINALDLLINNAGVLNSEERLGNLNAKTMLETLHTNAVSPALLIQALRELLKQGEDPKVVNISSGMGSLAEVGAGLPSYRASKSALNMYSASLAIDLRNDGIIVIPMSPGWVKTDMGGSNAQLDVQHSVSSQLAVIDQLTLEDSGRFLSWDGSEMDW